MSNFLDWFLNNLPISIIFIIVFLVLVIALLILFRLSCKSSKVFVALFTKLPDFINEAEQMGFTAGDNKLQYVLQQSLAYLIVLTGKSAKKIVSQYSSLVSSTIESILSTPQKKGVSICSDEK